MDTIKNYAGADPYSVIMVMEDIPFSYYDVMKDLGHHNILSCEKSLLITETIDGTLANYVRTKAEELFLQENEWWLL